MLAESGRFANGGVQTSVSGRMARALRGRALWMASVTCPAGALLRSGTRPHLLGAGP